MVLCICVFVLENICIPTLHSISHLMKQINLEFIETFHIFSMMGWDFLI